MNVQKKTVIVLRAVAVILGLHAVLSVHPTWAVERLQGVFFDPLPAPPAKCHWLLDYHKTRDSVETELAELVKTTNVNFVDIHVLIPNTLKVKATPPSDKATTPAQWANMQTLDNLADFVDLCHRYGVKVEIDLANNMWVPFSVDTAHHIGRNEWWPRPDDTPWTESRVWYTQIIEYVEARSKHSEAIAMWCMFGNYQFGAAEPVLWGGTATQWGERFVKEVWPAFMRAGKRPKAAPIMLPIMLPIMVDIDGLNALPARERLRAFTNLKRWLVNELRMPPDYWVMSTYPVCDPAKDGFKYLREIVRILGPSGARRLISTDFKLDTFKGEGKSGTILGGEKMSDTDVLRWHFGKIDEYSLAGWWIWSYRDTPSERTGLREASGQWKAERVKVIRERCERKGSLNAETTSGR